MEYLNCTERVKNSVHSARRSRREGRIPGIIYGDTIKSFMFEIAEMDLSREIARGGEHSLINVKINGTPHRALIKEIQRDPVNHKVIHIDLEEVDSDKIIHSEVPIIFIGEERLGRNGGILQKERDSVKVQCRASALPKHINVDLTGLTYGQTYRIRDIEAAADITFMEDPNTVIAAVTGENTNVTTPGEDDTPYPNETKIHNPE
jgi:large subunit ribosomal protein L25